MLNPWAMAERVEFLRRSRPCTNCGGIVGEYKELTDGGIVLVALMTHRDEVGMMSPDSIDRDCPRIR